MKIALSAMDQAWEDKQANLMTCRKLAARAAALGADLLIFPEMTLTGFTSNAAGVAEDSDASASMKSFSEMAREHRIGVIAGMVLASKDRFENCALAYDRNGAQLCRYAKIHPFSLSGEARDIRGGDALATFEHEGTRFGLTICYDLRFPMIWQALGDQCDCIVNIANWPARRVRHWTALLMARAIENQVYVIGVNRVGVDGNGLTYAESSLAFSPDGIEIIPSDADEGLRIIEIEKRAVKEIRDAFPVRRDRRHNLYDELLMKRAGT